MKKIKAEIVGGSIVLTIPLPVYRKFLLGAKEMQTHLTPREREVLERVQRGLQNKEIGDELHISVRTVKLYVSSLLQKHGVRSRLDLALVTQTARQSP